MKERNFKKGKSNFKGSSYKQEVSEALIEEISLNSKGRVSITGVINRIVQTGGPTIFVVTDGTGSLSLKGFIKPGERAYPEINENDVIKAVVEVGEYNGEIEGEISSIKKLGDNEKKEFIKNLRALEKEKAKVTPPEFLVKNQILNKLRERFIEAATQIRLAIIQDRPLIVRHHNDADGYSSGFSLERAIIPLIEKHHSSLKAPWEFFLRAPSQAPYYEIDDSIRDMANSLRNVAKFSNKMPLIIIADNGSTPEDLMGIKQGKVHGADFIVIDHHAFDKDVISSEVLVHISPFLVGEDGSHFSAGMLCSELARFINPDVENINQIPAMAGFADRIDLGNPKVMEEYLKIAEKEGYSKELLSDIALVIDYVSAKVRFMEAREYIEVLFGEPRKRQKELVSLMAPYIRELDRKGLEIGRSNSKHEKIGKTTLQTIKIEETFPGFGFFPKPGRAVSLVHDNYQKEKGVSSLVTAGIMPTAITLRATDEANFSFHELLKFISKKSPESFVAGGGHKNAGSLTFLPYKKEEVVNLLREFLKGR
ncbi:MAG: OB-fold nucleic acid binding domain-containing protein [Nanoarchaeota archaeon]|nr:OB-fold nucleic acid binding domain-containing protein [Nanoarchaeota archaeon]